MSMKKMLSAAAVASLMATSAFAANPFSDVPMNHWAYDAVEQLSAKGILEGYPNGTFKGNKSMTRYEIATMVARMMANGGISGAELEKLKALVVEFQPELEALGVKVDGFDSRISALEKGVGGLKIWGQMHFDYLAWKEQDKSPNKNGFNFNRARLFMHKDLSDNVSWEMRWHNDKIDRYWVTTKDTFGLKGLTMRFGQFYQDWEGPDGLYQSNAWWDNDATFMDTSVRGVDLNFKRGGFELAGLFASNIGAGATGVYTANAANEVYGARIKYDAGKFFASANMYAFNMNDSDNSNYKAYWFVLGIKPIKGLGLTGVFFKEKIDEAAGMTDDSPKAYKVILDLDQSLLKFTSLRFEYGKYDQGFIYQNGVSPYTVSSNNHVNINSLGAKPLADDMKIIHVNAIQKWGKKFSTYERWGKYKMDKSAKEWTIGLAYQYSPALQFSLSYTDFDGRISASGVDETYDNRLIRFRTFLNF